MTAARGTGSGRELQPGEMALAATMAAVCIGLDVLGSLVPQLGSLQLMTVVPFGIVAHRQGPRALVATLAAAALVAGLVAGLGSAVGLLLFAVIGGLVGELKRRGRGIGTLWLATAVLAPVTAGVIVLLLLVFASARTLALQNVRSTLRGIAAALHHVGALRPVAAGINDLGASLVHHWALYVAVAAALLTVVALLVSWTLVGEVLERLRWVGSSRLSVPDRKPGESPHPVPLPVDLRQVAFHYGDLVALSGVDLRIGVGEFVAVTGDNGSGKSTLARLLAGAAATAGTIQRPGSVGLGQIGGTALIGQRPDAQVLGLRVRDDLLWGLPPGHEVDVDELLETVGLPGMASRDTASLSGGQLQRVAVAAALARNPQLLISDESTAMVDRAGRSALLRLLAELPRHRPMSVVHITHDTEEIGAADRVVRLEQGRVISDLTRDQLARLEPTGPAQAGEPPHPVATDSGTQPDPAPAPPAEAVRVRVGRLCLDGVGHAYAYGTLWEHWALRDVSLCVEPGEGVLIVGENGSGKSTLAWIVAGLMQPTAGTCVVDAVPSHRLRGTLGLAFQHARLQLQRPTVAAEIADVAGWTHGAHRDDASEDESQPEPERRVAEALRAVRLDPALAERSIEQLSGGQQRRVALAGLLARQPRVLVLDEPLAGLDTGARDALTNLLADLRARQGLTLIVVTHDPEPLSAVCPRCVRLEQGRIVADTGGPGDIALEARAA